MTENEIATNDGAKFFLQVEKKTFESWYANQCHQVAQNRLDRKSFKVELEKRVKKICNINSNIEFFNLLAFYDKMCAENDSNERKELKK